jgi:peptidoglycan/LPS O-acetylase OafA/YrhL
VLPATPTPRRPRYDALDAWRGLACLCVVVYHCTNSYAASHEFLDRVRDHGGSALDWLLVLTSKLWVGVPVFFVISGYCIAATADAARDKPRPAATFFLRRLKRIYPPLWAYLAVCLGLLALLPAWAWFRPVPGYSDFMFRPEHFSFWQWVGSFTLTEEWRPYLVGPPKMHYSIQLWTLCYEEQFYVVVGLILLVARRWLFPLLTLVTAIVFLNVADLSAWPGLRAYQWKADGLFLNGLWLSFAAGVAVYYRVARATPTIARCLEVFLLVLFLWSLRAVPGWWAFASNGPGNMVIAFAFAVLLCGLHRFDAALSKARWLAPLRWCGRMCYSLYLVHLPVTLFGSSWLHHAGFSTPAAALFVVVPVCTAASLLAAWGFYHPVEKRFLNAPQRPITQQTDAAERREVVAR